MNKTTFSLSQIITGLHLETDLAKILKAGLAGYVNQEIV